MNKQLKFYLDKEVNPVEILKDQQGIDGRHISHRMNLLEKHLKIPFSLFDQKTVLEFGPCGGENSLILASLGAKVSLVEPNSQIHPLIENNFNTSKLSKQLVHIYSDTIESFETDQQYDFVIAEGFIHALPNRSMTINKLKKLSKGLVIVSYSCAFGNLFEALKRYVFKRCLENINSGENYGVIAEQLYKEDFDRLGSARTFDSWVQDILINPAAESSMLDRFDELYPLIQGEGFEYFSGSPAWDQRSHHQWYKNGTSIDLLDEWRRNIGFFITGSTDVRFTYKQIEMIASLTSKMLDYSSSVGDSTPADITDGFSGCDHPLLSDIHHTLEVASTRDADELVMCYLNSNSRKYWGMPHHYVVLSRPILSVSNSYNI
jgi:hypothetical protein